MGKPTPELFIGADVRLWDVDPAVYQLDRDHVRRTYLELLRESPALYDLHVLRGVPIPETKALRVGRALHVAVLQPHLVESLVVCEPAVNKRTKAGKAELRQWMAERRPDAIVLTRDERETVSRMAHALRSDPRTAGLLERDGATELPLRWQDPATGFWCKAMLDKYFETKDGSQVRVLDIKSADDPSAAGFSRSTATYGYHRQDAMYRDAATRYAGGRPTTFAFLVVRNKAPFECALYDLDAEAVSAGRRQIRSSLDQLARHVETNEWRAPWQGPTTNLIPQTISLPAYALKEAA